MQTEMTKAQGGEWTETDKRVRLNEVKQLMQHLGEAVLKDFNVKFEAKDKWIYDIQTWVVNYVEADCFSLTNRQIIGRILLIIATKKFSSTPSPIWLPQPIRLFAQLVNAVEEVRVQEQMMAYHPGTRDSFKYMFEKDESEISTQIEALLQPHLGYLNALRKQFWKGSLASLQHEVKEALMKTEEALQDAYDAESTQASVDILKRDVWPTFEALFKEPPPNPGSGSGWSSSSSSGEWEGKGEGWEWQGQGSGQGKKQPLTDEQKEQLKKQFQEALKHSNDIEKLRDAMKQASQDKKEELKEAEWQESSFGQDVDEKYDEMEGQSESQSKGGAAEGNYDDEILQMAKDLETGWVGANPMDTMRRGERVPYEILYREIYHLVPFFKKKLQSIMKDNLYDRMGGNYRSGKLNTKKLYKVATGSDKVFTRPVHRLHKDYKVTILVDESGSMTSGNKNLYAAQACVLIAEVLHSAEIDFEIRGFNQYFRVYKKFGQKFNWDVRRQIENIIPNSSGNWAGCNNDGYAVNLAAHGLRMASNRTTERMLFVLSDGQPAMSGDPIPAYDKSRHPGKSTVHEFDLKTEIEAASKDITVVGIGINARHVRDYYPDSVICDTTAELPDLILSKLRWMIKRG